MKKILTILGTIALMATTSTSVVACGSPAEKGLPANDLRSIIKVTDLGLINGFNTLAAPSRITSFFEKALDLGQEKNANFTDEIRSNLVSETSRLFNVNGTNVSLTLVPKEEYSKVVGKITFNFTTDPILLPSLLDINYFVQSDLGEIIVEGETDSPTDLQILETFFELNPIFKEVKRMFFTSVLGNKTISSMFKENGKSYVLISTMGIIERNYDLTLGNLFFVEFTTKK